MMLNSEQAVSKQMVENEWLKQLCLLETGKSLIAIMW